jgi:hypothetical protein
MRRLVALLAALLSCVEPARAVELHLRFEALERLLSQQVFTQEGRRYVHGSATAKCNFAYLEKPHVDGADGQLRIHARFTGRSALNMFGQCVGLGDAFDMTVTAIPVYKDGNIGLKNVTAVSDNKHGYYIRLVCDAMAESLRRDFKYPIATAAKAALEDPGAQPGYPRELHDFKVTDISVSKDALVIAVDFNLTVK